MTKAQDEWYVRNRERILAGQAEKNRKLREAKRKYIQELKESLPCADCGNHFPYYVTQFDHTGTDKIANVSDLVNRLSASWSRINDEIAKCELVCANCHAIRTHARLVER